MKSTQFFALDGSIFGGWVKSGDDEEYFISGMYLGIVLLGSGEFVKMVWKLQDFIGTKTSRILLLLLDTSHPISSTSLSNFTAQQANHLSNFHHSFVKFSRNIYSQT